MSNETRRGVLEMSAAMTISGTIGWFVVTSGEPVIDVVFWRCAIGALCLLIVCTVLGYLRPGIISKRQFAIAVAGGVAIVANWLLLFAAYPHASIAVATTVYNTQPFMLLGLGALFFGEKITLARLGWLLLAFFGMIAIVQGKAQAPGEQGSYLTGILLALGAAFFYALAAIAAKWLKGVPPHLIALIHVTTGTAMLAPFLGFDVMPSSSDVWPLLITLGIVHTGLMYVLLYGAIQRLPTHLTGALSFIYPIASILVDRIAFGHQLHPMQIAGAAVILFAAAGINLGWTVFRGGSAVAGTTAGSAKK